MRQSFEIQGRLLGMNDYIKAAHSPWQRSQLKQENEAIVAAAAHAAGIEPVTAPFEVEITYFEGKTKPRERVRDLDNVIGGGNKVILDALVSIGVLPNDDPASMPAITARGYKANPDMGGPRIRVTITDKEG